jgi:tetratricopeptide (TPR) repeat protein
VSDISDSDNKQIVNLKGSYDITDILYTNIIECNLSQLNKLCQAPCIDQQAMLRAGYIYSVLGDNEKSIPLFKEAMYHFNTENDFFHLLICQQNICKVSIIEEQNWYVLKNNLSKEDKDAFRTLYDYLSDSDEIYQKTVEAFNLLKKKFDVNYHSVYWDKENLTFLNLRYNVHQIQKYFILNNIYIKGYSEFTQIIGNWLKALDLYVDLVLMLHSPKMKMHRGKTIYLRNELNKEDIYSYYSS